MATFWEIAAHLVDPMFSFVILVISHFGFEGWIWVLIASAYFLLFSQNVYTILKPGIKSLGQVKFA